MHRIRDSPQKRSRDNQINCSHRVRVDRSDCHEDKKPIPLTEREQVICMKKLLFFLLSVVLIGSVGCGSKKDLSMEVTDAESTEVVNETVEPTTEAVTVETEDAETAQQESTEAVTEVDFSADTKDTGKDNQSDNMASEEKTADNKQSEENKNSDSQESEKQPKDTKSEPASEQQPKPEENSKPEEKPEEKPEPKPEPQAVSYSPEKVVSLAISKCQAGGMVTTEQHLKDNLNAGKITQEEYNEYYPLDGLEDSYYSVFVNVDLNKAATTSGRTLGSEEEIAQYIADMLLLESDSVFNIRYTGTTKTSGETFYEFRCYR